MQITWVRVVREARTLNMDKRSFLVVSFEFQFLKKMLRLNPYKSWGISQEKTCSRGVVAAASYA
jgi:hypothetical protein